jgi:DNA-binding Xre family transcriptional regulator
VKKHKRRKNMTKTVKYPSLKGEMAKRGVKPGDLAELLEMSEDSVRRRLRGEVEFDLTEIVKIMKFFGCKFSELFEC